MIVPLAVILFGGVGLFVAGLVTGLYWLEILDRLFDWKDRLP